MDVSLIDQNKKQGKLRFLLKKTSSSYVNTLRRIMMGEVPTMAIEDIEIKANNSVLYDEMIALRLGLVPLTTDLKAYNLPQNCTCKGAGCARCQLKMTLKAKGPKTVHSGDIKTKDPKVKPFYDKIPILKLLEGQSVELEATATLGLGKDHMKWSPGLIFYKNSPEIKITKQPKDPKKIMDACPKGVFDVKGGKLIVNDKKLPECDLCDACIDIAEKNEMEVKPKESEFIFDIESWGQLSPTEIVKKAVNVFDDKLENFKKIVK